MARNYNNKALLTYLGIAIGLILFAVVIITLLGNERRKQEVKVLRRQLKEKFENHSPSHSPSHSNSVPLSPAEADVELDNLMNKLNGITGGN